jgi:predicted nucleic acid-binding protein
LLATARELDVKLVTEDARLRRAAPALTQTIEQALSA